MFSFDQGCLVASCDNKLTYLRLYISMLVLYASCFLLFFRFEILSKMLCAFNNTKRLYPLFLLADNKLLKTFYVNRNKPGLPLKRLKYNERGWMSPWLRMRSLTEENKSAVLPIPFSIRLKFRNNSHLISIQFNRQPYKTHFNNIDCKEGSWNMWSTCAIGTDGISQPGAGRT